MYSSNQQTLVFMVPYTFITTNAIIYWLPHFALFIYCIMSFSHDVATLLLILSILKDNTHSNAISYWVIQEYSFLFSNIFQWPPMNVMGKTTFCCYWSAPEVISTRKLLEKRKWESTQYIWQYELWAINSYVAVFIHVKKDHWFGRIELCSGIH